MIFTSNGLHGHEVAISTSLDAKNAETGVRVVEGHALDEAGEHFLTFVSLGRRRRVAHR